MGKEMRYDIYDLRMLKPEPLVPRHLRLEVPERLDKDGNVLIPLDERQRRRSDRDASASPAPRPSAVCFLHSSATPPTSKRSVRRSPPHCPV